MAGAEKLQWLELSVSPPGAGRWERSRVLRIFLLRNPAAHARPIGHAQRSVLLAELLVKFIRVRLVAESVLPGSGHDASRSRVPCAAT